MVNNVNSFILVGVLAGLVAILDYIGVITFPIGFFGVSAFYIGAAFYMAFSVWFGIRGSISIYIGLLIGALIAGTFTIFAFILAWGNVFGAAIPMVMLRSSKFSMDLKRKRDYLVYLLSATIAQPIVGAIWTLGGFTIFGIMPPEALVPAMIGWIGGGMVVSVVIGIPLLKGVTPVVKKTSLFRKTLV